METFIATLRDIGFELISGFLSAVFGLIISVVQIKKYKYSKNQSKENDLKYRTEDYQSAKGFVKDRQSFKSRVPVYELDPKTNNLIVVGEKDLQEFIQSSADCALSKILEKYGTVPPIVFPQGSSESSEVFDASDIRDDFEVMSDISDTLDDMRERYSMPNASPDELFRHVAKLNNDNNLRISELKARELALEQLKKEVKDEV